jgi:hypothetical protein
VVAAEESDAGGIAELEREKEEEGLEAEIAAIDVITQKKVVRVGALATDRKEIEQVEELAVGVATDRDGRIHADNVRESGEELNAEFA